MINGVHLDAAVRLNSGQSGRPSRCGRRGCYDCSEWGDSDLAGAAAAMGAATGPGFSLGRKVVFSMTTERMGDLGLDLDLDVH